MTDVEKLAKAFYNEIDKKNEYLVLMKNEMGKKVHWEEISPFIKNYYKEIAKTFMKIKNDK